MLTLVGCREGGLRPTPTLLASNPLAWEMASCKGRQGWANDTGPMGLGVFRGAAPRGLRGQL